MRGDSMLDEYLGVRRWEEAEGAVRVIVLANLGAELALHVSAPRLSGRLRTFLIVHAPRFTYSPCEIHWRAL